MPPDVNDYLSLSELIPDVLAFVEHYLELFGPLITLIMTIAVVGMVLGALRKWFMEVTDGDDDLMEQKDKARNKRWAASNKPRDSSGGFDV